LGCSSTSYPEPCAPPAVAQGTVYVGAGGDFVARDAGTGILQWTAHTDASIHSSPAVVDGVVYVASWKDFTANRNRLYAFDAAGTTNCSGSPKVCTPLWTADLGFPQNSAPTVANGVVYVTTGGEFCYVGCGWLAATTYAFDAAGTSNCSGSPKLCTPLWTASSGSGAVSSPAVANGVVYVTASLLYAFDAAGTTNCSGTPKICRPLWTASGWSAGASAAVANGVVYVASQDRDPVRRLRAFDAAGTTNCSGSPKVCTPLWTAAVGYQGDAITAPAIANGVVYFSEARGGGGDGLLSAFDAAGTTKCSGSPKVCTPLWTAAQPGWGASSPAVANGVVYATYWRANGLLDGFAGIRAYDAAGTINCSGTPKTCAPLWNVVAHGPGVSSVSSPVIANGAVYFNADTVYKFALPS
jgi:hypothetical protein